MPNLSLNNTEYYYAPKNGSTTVRMWIKQYETGLGSVMVGDGYYNLQPFGLPKLYETNEALNTRFCPSTAEGQIRWCIKRDPIDRFISGYTDKILHERLIEWSVEQCISMLEDGSMVYPPESRAEGWVAAHHLIGQHHWLGESAGYYDHVFDLRQMQDVKAFCEETVFRMPLTDFHARELALTDVEKVRLTSSQIGRLQVVFAKDYAAGWC
jgi:hypothetical protein